MNSLFVQNYLIPSKTGKNSYLKLTWLKPSPLLSLVSPLTRNSTGPVTKRRWLHEQVRGWASCDVRLSSLQHLRGTMLLSLLVWMNASATTLKKLDIILDKTAFLIGFTSTILNSLHHQDTTKHIPSRKSYLPKILAKPMTPSMTKEKDRRHMELPLSAWRYAILICKCNTVPFFAGFKSQSTLSRGSSTRTAIVLGGCPVCGGLTNFQYGNSIFTGPMWDIQLSYKK